MLVRTSVFSQTQMKNSSAGSSPCVPAESSSVLFSTEINPEQFGSVTVLLFSKSRSVEPPEPHAPHGVRLCGRRSVRSWTTAAAGLSGRTVIRRSVEEERGTPMTAESEQGETATPVSTLVSDSSSSSSSGRWGREQVMEAPRVESGWLKVESWAGLLHWEE